MDIKTLADKVVVVVGGTSGIGRATAVAFGREGAKVVIAGRRINLGNEVVTEIENGGGEALFVKTDVRQPEDVEHLFQKVVQRYGRLDIAFNNAGASLPHVPTTNKTKLDEWEMVMETNARGVWLCMRQEIAQMLKQDGGIIVNTASILGFSGEYGLTQYCASKHAILALTKTASLEFARNNIRINAVCPGPIMTDMVRNAVQFMPGMPEYLKNNTAIKRIGEPEEISGAVLWLCSDEAAYMVGNKIVIDGGYTT